MIRTCKVSLLFASLSVRVQTVVDIFKIYDQNKFHTHDQTRTNFILMTRPEQMSYSCELGMKIIQ